MGYYYIIPAELVEGDNPRKAFLYGLIVSLSNKKGYADAYNKFLAEKLKISISRVRELLTELENEGWIKIINRSSRKRKIYISANFNSRIKEDEVVEVRENNNETDIKPNEKLVSLEKTQQISVGLPNEKLSGSNYNKSNIYEYYNNRPPGAVNDIPKNQELTLKDYITIFYEHYKAYTGEKFIFNDIEIRFLKLLLKKLKTRENFEKIINVCKRDSFWGPQMSPRILYSKLNYFIAKEKVKNFNHPSKYDPKDETNKWVKSGFITADSFFQEGKNE